MMRDKGFEAKIGRIEEINYLRGFGVLAVIAIHTTGYFTEVKQFGALTLAALWTDVFSQFAVPLFILISGFVLAKNYPNNFSLKDFYKKRARSILPQYLIFSALYTAFNHWAAIKTNSLSATMTLLLKNIWRAEASYHLWYFLLIIVFYLLYPLIIKLYRFFKRREQTELFIALLLILQMLFMVGLHTSYLSGIRINALGFVFYFGLGIYVFDHFDSLKASFKRQTHLLFTMSLALTLGSSFFIILGLTMGYRYNTTPPYFFIGSELVYPVFRVITFLLLFNWARTLLRKKKSISAKVIHKIGEYSFGIYLIHIFFNQTAIKILKNKGIGFDDWIFYPIVFTVTVILSYISIRWISFIPYSYYIIGYQSKK